jgi:hypothetical protein
VARALGVGLLDRVRLACGCAREERAKNGLIAAPSEQGIQLLHEDALLLGLAFPANVATQAAFVATTGPEFADFPQGRAVRSRSWPRPPLAWWA